MEEVIIPVNEINRSGIRPIRLLIKYYGRSSTSDQGSHPNRSSTHIDQEHGRDRHHRVQNRQPDPDQSSLVWHQRLHHGRRIEHDRTVDAKIVRRTPSQSMRRVSIQGIPLVLT